MSRWQPEDLKKFETRAEGWRKNGTVREHRITDEDRFPGVDIDSIHRKRKYGNQPTMVDGITFHSKREAERWKVLRLREAAGEIKELKHQVRFDLKVKNYFICAYIADFGYVEKGKLVVEDSKGARTKDYIIKRKLMLACHGIEVLET